MMNKSAWDWQIRDGIAIRRNPRSLEIEQRELSPRLPWHSICPRCLNHWHIIKEGRCPSCDHDAPDQIAERQKEFAESIPESLF